MKIVKIALAFTTLFLATIAAAQGKSEETAVRNIIQDEVAAWNHGDAQAYSRHFAADCTFTNILGTFFTGQKAVLDRHEQIFKGAFRGTVLRQDIVSVRFVRPEIAIVETLNWISGFSPSGPPSGTHADDKGRLRTRLLQLMVKDGGEWKIATYHNVDVKPGVDTPEPQ